MAKALLTFLPQKPFFDYDEAGEVSWFDVHNPRLMHHRFGKVKD